MSPWLFFSVKLCGRIFLAESLLCVLPDSVHGAGFHLAYQKTGQEFLLGQFGLRMGVHLFAKNHKLPSADQLKDPQ